MPWLSWIRFGCAKGGVVRYRKYLHDAQVR